MTKRERYLTTVNTIYSVILMSLVFMWLMPYGSFDPKEIGFYICIVLAILLEISLIWFLKKFRVKDSHKDNS